MFLHINKRKWTHYLCTEVTIIYHVLLGCILSVSLRVICRFLYIDKNEVQLSITLNADAKPLGVAFVANNPVKSNNLPNIFRATKLKYIHKNMHVYMP